MIEVKNLIKYYKTFKAVDDISFTINQGEIVGLLGPNGAGKSTIIRTLCGYLFPTSGRIKIGDHFVDENPLEVKKMIGYLPELAPLYNDMLVYDYLLFIAKVRETDKGKIALRVDEMIKLCGLSDVVYKNINELSKGYKQRVGLAYALMGDPQVLVLDEPTSGLDPNQIIEIRKLIKKIGELKTIILSSHILSEVEVTCDRIIIINKGNIVANNKTNELKNQNNNRKTIIIELNNEIRDQIDKLKNDLKSIPSIKGFEEKKEDTFKIKITSEGDQDVRNDIFNLIKKTDLQIINFHQKDESLEDIFRLLTSIPKSPETLENPKKVEKKTEEK